MGEHAIVKEEQRRKVIDILKDHTGILQHEELLRLFGQSRTTLYHRLDELEQMKAIKTFREGAIKYIRLLDVSLTDPETQVINAVTEAKRMLVHVTTNYGRVKKKDRALVLTCLAGWLTFDYYNTSLFRHFAPDEYQEPAKQAEANFRDMIIEATGFLVSKCKEDEDLANQVSLRFLQISYQLLEQIKKAGVFRVKEAGRALR